jgi:hypothetical protein
MNTPDHEQHPSDIRMGIRSDPAPALELILTSARLLFANGQTTRTMVRVVKKLSVSLGVRATVFPRWGELTVRIEDAIGSHFH